MNLSKLKAALTRAKNSGNPDRILAAVREAYAAFNADYWPDCWATWEIAERDALAEKARKPGNWFK